MRLMMSYLGLEMPLFQNKMKLYVWLVCTGPGLWRGSHLLLPALRQSEPECTRPRLAGKLDGGV